MFFIRHVQKELYDEIGRSLNFTCGSTCTYPVLGMGALLAYSLLQRADLGQDNQLSRIGQTFAAKTGLGHLSERMSNVHTEGWLVGSAIYCCSSKEDGWRSFKGVGRSSSEESQPPEEWAGDVAPKLEKTEHTETQLRNMGTNTSSKISLFRTIQFMAGSILHKRAGQKR